MAAMSLMARLQLFAIFVAASSLVFDHVALGHVAPARNLLINNLVFGAFVLWWAGSIVYIRWKEPARDDTPDGWYLHTLAVFWLGNAATATSFWLLLPYGSEATRLTAAMMMLGPVAVEAIGTVRTPPERRGLLGTLAPVGIPLCIIPWFLTSSDPYRITVSIFIFAFLIMMVLLRAFIQQVVDRAYAAQTEAEAARDAKSRFLAAASHDLGQPLQAARLFLDQARAAPAPQARDQAAARVDWALGAMEQQLRQMLDHLRLDAREIVLQTASTPLSLVIARATELHEPAARLAGADIIALPTRRVVQADPALVDRALGNLVANAIRHGRARRILIGARPHGRSVRLWVVDDGRGIEDIDRARLFEDFTQGLWAQGDEVRGGFGLGLSSVKRMAELMGGSAGHDPRWRGGAAFWLELPTDRGLALA
jgi:signal transduction histidine kinase